MTDWITWFFVVWAILATILYYKEQQYRRDVLTDLVQLIHEYDIQRDELRRSVEYDEIEKYVDRQD